MPLKALVSYSLVNVPFFNHPHLKVRCLIIKLFFLPVLVPVFVDPTPFLLSIVFFVTFFHSSQWKFNLTREY